jgi:hypothetical protein
MRSTSGCNCSTNSRLAAGSRARTRSIHSGAMDSAGLMQLEAEQRGEMASTFKRRKTEAYPEGMATGESH